MFSNKSNKPDSGLTKEDCKSMLAYLNKHYCPFPEYSHWESGVVGSQESDSLGLKSQTPIVRMHSVNYYRHGKNYDLYHLEIYEFFEKNFKGQYDYNDDSCTYIITNIDVLDRLKKEAQKYNAANEVNQVTALAQKL